MNRVLCMMRKWFPTHTRTYRLFDSSMIVLLVSVFWYVASTPSIITQGTVGETVLGKLSVQSWGLFMVLVSGFALLCVRMAHGKSSKWLDYGYGAVLLTTGGWASVLIVGAVGGYFLTGTAWDDAAKSIGSGLWFAYACSNTAAALMRERHVAVCSACHRDC